MKRLEILLLPPGWDASPSQGYPPALWSPVPIYTPGWRETMWNKVSCLRKRRQWPGSNHRPPDRKSNALTTRPPCLHFISESDWLFPWSVQSQSKFNGYSPVAFSANEIFFVLWEDEKRWNLGGFRASTFSLFPRVYSSRLPRSPTLRALYYSSTCYAG